MSSACWASGVDRPYPGSPVVDIIEVSVSSLSGCSIAIVWAIAPPSDWRRPSAVGCNCQHCTELGRFLSDPVRETWVFKAAQIHRNHVEESIRKARCDVDTITERRGSPHGLICTKNQASYQRRARQRVEDTANLAALSR